MRTASPIAPGHLGFSKPDRVRPARHLVRAAAHVAARVTGGGMCRLLLASGLLCLSASHTKADAYYETNLPSGSVLSTLLVAAFGAATPPSVTQNTLSYYQVPGSGPVEVSFRLARNGGDFRSTAGLYRYTGGLGGLDLATPSGKIAYAAQALDPTNCIVLFDEWLVPPPTNGTVRTVTLNGGERFDRRGTGRDCSWHELRSGRYHDHSGTGLRRFPQRLLGQRFRTQDRRYVPDPVLPGLHRRIRHDPAPANQPLPVGGCLYVRTRADLAARLAAHPPPTTSQSTV